MSVPVVDVALRDVQLLGGLSGTLSFGFGSTIHAGDIFVVVGILDDDGGGVVTPTGGSGAWGTLAGDEGNHATMHIYAAIQTEDADSATLTIASVGTATRGFVVGYQLRGTIDGTPITVDDLSGVVQIKENAFPGFRGGSVTTQATNAFVITAAGGIVEDASHDSTLTPDTLFTNTHHAEGDFVKAVGCGEIATPGEVSPEWPNYNSTGNGHLGGTFVIDRAATPEPNAPCVSYVGAATISTSNRVSSPIHVIAPTGVTLLVGDTLLAVVEGFDSLKVDSGDYLAIAGFERIPMAVNDAGTAFDDDLSSDSIIGGVFIRTYQEGDDFSAFLVTCDSPYGTDAPYLQVTTTVWRGVAPIVTDFSDAVMSYDGMSTNSGGSAHVILAPEVSGVTGYVAVYGLIGIASAMGPYSLVDGTTATERTSVYTLGRTIAVASANVRGVDGFEIAPQMEAVIAADGSDFAGSLGFTVVLIGMACVDAVCEVIDLFNRTASDTLGTPDSGGSYEVSGLDNGSVDVAALAYVRQTGSGGAVQLVLHSATVAADAEERIEWEWGDSLDAAALIAMRVQPDYSGYVFSARREDAEGGRIAVYAAADVRAFDPALDTLVVDALVPIAVDDDTRFQFVAQTLGSTVRAKYFPLDDDPGGWQVNATDTTITGPGRIGFGHRYTGSAWPFLTYFDVLSTQCVAAAIRRRLAHMF